MYIEKEKKCSAIKAVLIVAGIVVAVAAVVAAVSIWKKRRDAAKLIEEELDDEIGILLAEEDIQTADVKIVDCEEA